MDRGVVLTEVGRFGLEPIEVDAPGEGEVAVRIEASGVCHSDLHVIETGWAHRLPVLLGHEAAGIVEAVGPGVEAPREGDRVVLGWRSPCGRCRWCLRGDARRCRTPPRAARRLRLAGRAAALADAPARDLRDADGRPRATRRSRSTAASPPSRRA